MTTISAASTDRLEVRKILRFVECIDLNRRSSHAAFSFSRHEKAKLILDRQSGARIAEYDGEHEEKMLKRKIRKSFRIELQAIIAQAPWMSRKRRNSLLFEIKKI